METIRDFEDMLYALEKHRVRYLIIGGLAVIYHAKPRYTKDMDLWIDPSKKNIDRANAALARFGSPALIDHGKLEQILQIGVAPDRIDIILTLSGARFSTAWRNRIRGRYGKVQANWIDLSGLIRLKRKIDHPRHQEDLRLLLEVRKRNHGKQ